MVRIQGDKKSIAIGNCDALITITKVTNLFCPACKIEHNRLSDLFMLHPDLFCLNIVLLVDESGRNKDEMKIALSIVENIIQHKDENLMINQFKDWFNIMEYSEFIKKYTKENTKESYTNEAKEILRAQRKWINEKEIHKAPTYLINGQVLDNVYGVSDFLFLMPSLHNRLKNT